MYIAYAIFPKTSGMMIFVTLACILNVANCKAPTQNGSTNNQHYRFESLVIFEQKK
jgi:hypothetical protein